MPLLTLFDFLGTLAFAISGALKAVRRRMDPFGMIVLAVVTAIGGGTIRDAMLGVTPFWFTDRHYIYLSLVGSGAVYLLYRVVSKREIVVLWFDALGLGAFTVLGASRAMEHGLGMVETVVLACITGTGGGVLRDVLASDIPVVLRKEVYASACILGAFLYWYLKSWSVSENIAATVAVVTVVTVRLVSLHMGFGLAPLQPDELKESK